MIKGIDFLIQSSSNECIESHFLVGYFYQQGKYIEKYIKKSIYYYKEASSFNNQYAKNNLGIIYKNGFEKGIPQNIGFVITYFDETIQHFNDKICMYNLAHIYIYNDQTKEKIDEAIKLLINSSKQFFSPSEYLLCIALIKNYGFDRKKIENEISSRMVIQEIPFIAITNF